MWQASEKIWICSSCKETKTWRLQSVFLLHQVFRETYNHSATQTPPRIIQSENRNHVSQHTHLWMSSVFTTLWEAALLGATTGAASNPLCRSLNMTPRASALTSEDGIALWRQQSAKPCNFHRERKLQGFEAARAAAARWTDSRERVRKSCREHYSE